MVETNNLLVLLYFLYENKKYCPFSYSKKHSRLFSGFVHVKMAILQVFVQANFALKGRYQMHSKIAGAQNLILTQYNIEMYILIF